MPQYPRPPATDRRYQRHVEQMVDDRPHTQQRDASSWGVRQWGQRHVATPPV
jgi:hypothetical protein